MTNREAADILENRLWTMEIYYARHNGRSDRSIETIEAIHTAIECLRKESE